MPRMDTWAARQKNRLAAKIAATNAGNAYANKLSVVLRNYFRQYIGKKIIKVSGELLQKIGDGAEAVFPPQVKPVFQVYADRLGGSSLSYSVRACSTIGKNQDECSTAYHTVHVLIGEMSGDALKNVAEVPLELRCDYTAEEVHDVRHKVKVAEVALRNAKTDVYHVFGEHDNN